jgi:hypothetical protein
MFLASSALPIPELNRFQRPQAFVTVCACRGIEADAGLSNESDNQGRSNIRFLDFILPSGTAR